MSPSAAPGSGTSGVLQGPIWGPEVPPRYVSTPENSGSAFHLSRLAPPARLLSRQHAKRAFRQDLVIAFTMLSCYFSFPLGCKRNGSSKTGDRGTKFQVCGHLSSLERVYPFSYIKVHRHPHLLQNRGKLG